LSGQGWLDFGIAVESQHHVTLHVARSTFVSSSRFSLHSVKRLVSATDAECVHCAVRTEFYKMNVPRCLAFDLLNTRAVHFPLLYALSLNLALLPSFFLIIFLCSPHPSFPSLFSLVCLRWPMPVASLRRRCATARWRGLRVRISPGAWMFVSCECYVFYT